MDIMQREVNIELGKIAVDDCCLSLRPGPIYRPDCPYAFRPDGRRLISYIKTGGVCLT